MQYFPNDFDAEAVIHHFEKPGLSPQIPYNMVEVILDTEVPGDATRHQILNLSCVLNCGNGSDNRRRS